VVHLHPDDLMLVADRLSDSIRVEPDPAMTRGQLLVETAEGGLEDGPDQWRRALSEALGL
jgi:flagellar assembly protein FliH